MSYLKVGDYFPKSEEDENRIKKYKENKLLFEGSHDEVFKNIQSKLETPDEVAMTYLVANYCGLISKLSADMLFGENPVIRIADNDPADDRLQELINKNKLLTNFYESGLGNSYRGDSCMRVRFGKKTKYSTESEILIEHQNPQYYFVEQALDNIRQIDRQIIGWEFYVEEEIGFKQKYLKMEIHEPGKIYNYLYKMSGNRVTAELDIGEMFEDLQEEEDLLVDDFVIVHIPNWRTDDRLWGYSDYLDIRSLQDEANNRISQISRVLDKHADPKMRGPAEAMDDNNNVDVTGGKYFPYRVGEPIPEYLTWEAKLDASFKEIDLMLKMMFLVSETSPEAFGLSESGVQESGRALKYRLMRLLSKIKRKERYYDEGIKHLLYIAQLMDVAYIDGSNYEPERPGIEWRDGLPDDEVEKADITDKLNRARAISMEEKIRYNHPDWDDDKIQKEITRLEGELAEERTTQSFAL